MSSNERRQPTFLISFLAFFLFTSIQGQAMEYVWSLAQCTGVPGKVVNGVSSMLEVTTTVDFVFNERISAQHYKLAEEGLQEVIREIESNGRLRELPHEDQEFIQMENRVRTYYNRTEIAFLALDYVSACRKNMDTVQKSIQKAIKHQQKQPQSSAPNVASDISNLKTLSQLLDDMKINLGTTLNTKYHYVRGGGLWARWNKHSSSQTMRQEQWGVTSFSAPDLKTNAPLISWLERQKLVNTVAKDILDVYKKYIFTLGFILKHEDLIIFDLEEVGGINHYRRQLKKLFGSNFTPVNLRSELFKINIDLPHEIGEKADGKEKGGENPSAPSSPIPGSREGDTNGSGSTSSGGAGMDGTGPIPSAPDDDIEEVNEDA